MSNDQEWFDQKLQQLEQTAADVERKRLAKFLLRLFVVALAVCLVMFAFTAHAAKVTVTWTNPTANTDGTLLTNLAHTRVEWGSCNGTAFGVLQSFILVNAPLATTPIYPTGLAKVCVRGFAVNTDGVSSDASNVANKTLLSTPGKPVSLGQPIILE